MPKLPLPEAILQGEQLDFVLTYGEGIEEKVAQVRGFYKRRAIQFSDEFKLKEDTREEILKDVAIHEIIANARDHGPDGDVAVYATWEGWKFFLSVHDGGNGPTEDSIRSGGSVIIGDFATQQIREKCDRNGYTITVIRNLPVVLRRQNKLLKR